MAQAESSASVAGFDAVCRVLDRVQAEALPNSPADLQAFFSGVCGKSATMFVRLCDGIAKMSSQGLRASFEERDFRKLSAVAHGLAGALSYTHADSAVGVATTRAPVMIWLSGSATTI